MASVLTICSLSVFQYASVVKPMNKSLSNFRCLVTVLCAWIISVFLVTEPTIQTFSTANFTTLETEPIFLRHNFDVLGLCISFCFHNFFSPQHFRSSARTPFAHGSDVICLTSSGSRRARYLENETACL